MLVQQSRKCSTKARVKVTLFLAKACFAILFILIVQSGYSQKVVRLTKISTGKTQIIKTGQRVEYTLKKNPKPNYVGVVESISEDHLVVNGKSIAKDELKSLGRKRKGSGFWMTSSTILGGMLIVGAISTASYDPCPSCIDAGTSGEGWTAVQIGLGATVLGLGINTMVRNSPRDLISKWKLEIVDADNKPK